MHSEASVSADGFDELLSRLPRGLDLDQLARETGAIVRKRQLSRGRDLLRLALARASGGLSLSQTAAWGGLLGLARISDPAVKQRLDKASGLLEAIVAALLAAKTPGPAVHWAERRLRCGDGSCFREPGAATVSWRLHAFYDLGSGGFTQLELTDKHGGEGVDRIRPTAGEVAILDRNYAQAAQLQRYRQASGKAADFIVRIGWRAFSLVRADAGRFDLIEHLRRLPADQQPHEVAVLATVGPLDPPLPLRLIVQRKTAEATAAARETLRQDARRKQKVLDPRSLEAAAFMMLATSLPAAYPATEVLAVYRLRWQIELAFKRLKSLLGMSRLPTRTPQASRSWLLANLIMAVLCDGVSQEVLDSSP